MSDYDLVEVCSAEWAALQAGVLVALVIHPEDAEATVGTLFDVWCDDSTCLRMSVMVVSAPSPDSPLRCVVQSASFVMEVVR